MQRIEVITGEQKRRRYFSPAHQHLPKYGAGLLVLSLWGSLSHK
ncbi:hypothetical protein PZA22_07825 [Pectobacterium polaris]|nr:hypothetical protein [Pectobacterium polaris]MDE8754406.1 hypothetical protein [Pectobacterium polaris]